MPTTLPFPGTTFSTPAGRPHSFAYSANFSSDSADTGSFGFKPSYTYGGRSAATGFTLASYASAAGGNNPHQDAIGGELAGAVGPFYGQAEFTELQLNQEGKPRNNVDAFSVAGATTFLIQVPPFRAGEPAGWALLKREMGTSWARASRRSSARARTASSSRCPAFQIPSG